MCTVGPATGPLASNILGLTARDSPLAHLPGPVFDFSARDIVDQG